MSAYEEPYSQLNDHARIAAPWGWWITLGVVGTLSLVRFAKLWVRRRMIQRAAQVMAERDAQVPPPPGHITFSNLLLAISTAARRTLFIRRWHIYLYNSPTVAEVAWTVGYVVIFVSFTFYRAHENGIWNYQDAMGYMVFAQFPLIVGLAGKNNVISYATGISYERLNFLHRVAGRMAVLWAWIHAIGRIRLGLEAPHDFGSSYVAGGISALVALTVIEFTAEKPIRRGWYEVFIITHIAFVIMLIVGAWVHHPEVAHWIQAGLALWSLDRLVSLGRFIWNNQVWHWTQAFLMTRRGTVELLSGDVMRLTVRGQKMSWSPGHHVFLSCQLLGGISLERHPFSILSLPTAGLTEQDMTFLCRAQNGFTKRVRDSLTASTLTEVPIHVEGPYGVPVALDTYDTVILVGGGVGITYAMPHFVGVIHAIRAQRSLTRHVRLVWCTKSVEDVDWISPLLEAALAEPLPASIKVEVDIHITQSSKADDPEHDGGGIPESMRPLEELQHAPTDEEPVRRGVVLQPLPRVLPPGIISPVRIMIDADAPPPIPPRRGSLAVSSILSEKVIFPPSGPPPQPPQPRPPHAPPQVTYPPNLPNPPHPVESSRPLRTKSLPSIASDVTFVLPLPRPPGQLATCLAPYAHIRRVRAALGEVIKHDVGAARGPIHVGVCGPGPLSNVVRNAVAETMSPSKVLRGEQHTIDFHCEEPGW